MFKIWTINYLLLKLPPRLDEAIICRVYEKMHHLRSLRRPWTQIHLPHLSYCSCPFNINLSKSPLHPLFTKILIHQISCVVISQDNCCYSRQLSQRQQASSPPSYTLQALIVFLIHTWQGGGLEEGRTSNPSCSPCSGQGTLFTEDNQGDQSVALGDPALTVMH